MQKLIGPQVTSDTFPTTYSFQEEMEMSDLIEWYRGNQGEIEQQLLTKGAILIEGAGINSVEKFGEFTGEIVSEFRNYIDGNYPRRNLKDHVYISTEYDKNYAITMHNELSYSYKWPSKLLLGCVIPPGEGGETPLADSRKIVHRMRKDLLEEFERKQIKYIRNLHGGEGMGPSWQQTFETEDRKVVEAHCREIDIKFKWKDTGGLRLENTRPATRNHPVTGEKVWFNQVDQYHPSHFPIEVYETLMLLAQGNEEDLPLFVTFGDGSPVTEDIVKEVIDTIDKEVILRPWRKGDFVMIDNMLVAHGRKPYKGDRQVIVAMAQ